MLRGFQPNQTYHDLDDWHFADIAPSLGGRGIRVETCAELKRALDLAVDDESSFYLIEAMLPRSRTSMSLHKFTRAMRNLSAMKNE